MGVWDVWGCGMCGDVGCVGVWVCGMCGMCGGVGCGVGTWYVCHCPFGRRLQGTAGLGRARPVLERCRECPSLRFVPIQSLQRLWTRQVAAKRVCTPLLRGQALARVLRGIRQSVTVGHGAFKGNDG